MITIPTDGDGYFKLNTRGMSYEERPNFVERGYGLPFIVVVEMLHKAQTLDRMVIKGEA